MAHSGYASVGHILKNHTSDNDKAKIHTLRELCKLFLDHFSDKKMLKDSLIYKFDLFYGSIQPTVESFTKYVRSFLKKPGVDDYFIELKLEELIWKNFKPVKGCIGAEDLNRKSVAKGKTTTAYPRATY